MANCNNSSIGGERNSKSPEILDDSFNINSPRHLDLFRDMAGHNMGVGGGGDALAQHSDKFDAPYKAINTNDKLAFEARKILGTTPSLSTASTSSSLSSTCGGSSINIDRPRPSSSHGLPLYKHHHDQKSIHHQNKVVTNTVKKKEPSIIKTSFSMNHQHSHHDFSASSRGPFSSEEINLEKIFKVGLFPLNVLARIR